MTDYSIEIDEQGSLIFPSIEFNHSGVYKVVATNDSGMAEKEVTVNVMSEGCDAVESEGSGETKIPVAEFGRFVSEHHAQGNKKFRERFEVSLYTLLISKFYIKLSEAKQWRSRSYSHCLKKS